MLVSETMLAESIRCLSTTIPSSTDHTASLKVDTVCYNEFLHRIIADRRSSASKKSEGLLGSDTELRLKKVRRLTLLRRATISRNDSRMLRGIGK